MFFFFWNGFVACSVLTWMRSTNLSPVGRTAQADVWTYSLWIVVWYLWNLAWRDVKIKGEHRRKRYCNNHHIFLEEPFVIEAIESILGHADTRIHILNVSPGISPLSHWNNYKWFWISCDLLQSNICGCSSVFLEGTPFPGKFLYSSAWQLS